MNRMLLLMLASFASIVLPYDAQAQGTEDAKIVITTLASSAYPRLALQAHISGTVELSLEVRPDGSIASTTVVSGHPMLTEAASQSARQTKFRCEGCSQPLTPYRMTYKFELGDTLFCKGIDENGYGIYDAGASTHVSESGNTITISDRPFATCDPGTTLSVIKVRSAKCLYLWHCGKRYPL